MARWQEVVDKQIALWDFFNSFNGRKMAEWFGESVRDKAVRRQLEIEERFGWEAAQELSGISEPEIRDMPWTHHIGELNKICLANADPVYVSDDTSELWELARADFEPEPLMAEDLFTPMGFAYLAKPVLLKDWSHRLCSYRSFSWMPMSDDGSMKGGVFLSLYTHCDDPWEAADDEDEKDLKSVNWRGMGAELSLFHMMPMFFNFDYSPAPQHQVSREDLEGTPYELLAEIKSFFRLAQQKITTHDKMMPERPFRRRAEKFQPEKNDPSITVITLRKAKKATNNDDEGLTDVEWTHRWMVGGHWRNQWYPSLNIHRQIWISPYIKGPEWLELKIPVVRAFEFVR